LYQDGSSLWAATGDGLARIQDGRVLTLNTQNGLPCNIVHWMMEDDAGSAWVYMACGLARIARSELDAWASHSKQTINATVFESSDGVSTNRFTGGYVATVAKSANGNLWFLRTGGASVLDPHHLAFNKLPPPVHIEQITADDKTYDTTSGLRFPARVRNLDIDYTALSLVVPEKMRFRVKLEGQDKDWRELVNVRHVEYTNLAPRGYRFRVMACNNSGVWNEEGAALDFVIPPAWYQTNWFWVACIAAFLAMIWGMYQLRVRQLAAQFNMRMEERVHERTRIAREIHDTLLQSFHGLLMNFHTASRLLPGRPADAKQKLESAIDQAEEAILEGREAVQGLRVSTVQRNDLADAINTVGEELATASTNAPPARFRVVVEGTPRDLHPILRDEVYKIAAEALRNAFRHAQARHIEVEIRYDTQQFRLQVRDDGRGFDPVVSSSQGRVGHYGLPGMQERAKIAGGKLTVWSEVDAGTEVELQIPAGSAYSKTTSRWFSAAKARH
jgi:signal transduction histidine kinase